MILGDERARDAKYLDSCRKKRNELEYIRVDVVRRSEAGYVARFVSFKAQHFHVGLQKLSRCELVGSVGQQVSTGATFDFFPFDWKAKWEIAEGVGVAKGTPAKRRQ